MLGRQSFGRAYRLYHFSRSASGHARRHAHPIDVLYQAVHEVKAQGDYVAMVNDQVAHDRPTAMSAFAARKAKRSRATQNSSANTTNGHSTGRKLRSYQPGNDGGETLPPRKKQRTETNARTATNPTLQPPPPAGLPPRPQEGYSTSIHGNTKSSSVASDSADSGSGSPVDQTESNLAFDAQDKGPDSDYGLDVDE